MPFKRSRSLSAERSFQGSSPQKDFSPKKLRIREPSTALVAFTASSSDLGSSPLPPHASTSRRVCDVSLSSESDDEDIDFFTPSSPTRRARSISPASRPVSQQTPSISRPPLFPPASSSFTPTYSFSHHSPAPFSSPFTSLIPPVTPVPSSRPSISSSSFTPSLLPSSSQAPPSDVFTSAPSNDNNLFSTSLSSIPTTAAQVSPVRSQSLPPESSPAHRPIEDLPIMPAVKVAGRRGRPKGSKSKVSRRGQTREERAAATEAERLRKKEEQRQVQETRNSLKKAQKDLEDTLRKLEDTDNAWKTMKENICTPPNQGGAGFKNIGHFMASLMGPTLDTQTAANRTRWARDYGLDYMRSIARLAPQVEEEFFSDVLRRSFEREGQAIQKLMTRQWTTKILDLLQSFSMDELAKEFQAAAPTIWDALTSASTTAAHEGEQVQRDKSLVLTCMCAMISILRSQKANNFQLTMGLFLFGSGAAKREIAVLAHAGLCVSYASILDHVRKMSDA